MAETKQPNLNGAFYGPSIPPPPTSYHRRRCNPFRCLLSLIFAAVVTLGITVLVLWIIFRPNKLKFDATNVSLAEFSLSETNNTLYYNLQLNVSVRNPNKRTGVYYDYIEAQGFYEGERFGGFTRLPPFYQGHKNTTNLNVVFQGDSVVMLGSDEMENYRSERNSRVFSIDVKIYLRIRLKVGRVKTSRMKSKVKCELRVPLINSNGNGTFLSSGNFERTRCDFDW